MGVLGSIAGNVALFEMARFGVRRFVREARKDGRLHEWFHRYGLVAVFIPATVPILPLPLKFFVVSAGVLRMPRAKFFMVIVVSRVLRYFGDAFLGIRLGEDAQGFLQRNAWTLTGIAIGAAFVLLVDRKARSPTLDRTHSVSAARRPWAEPRSSDGPAQRATGRSGAGSRPGDGQNLDA